MEKKKMITSPFVPRPYVDDGIKKFDTAYKSIKIIDDVKEVGKDDKGQPIYVVGKKVLEEFLPIREVIDADASSVMTPDKIMLQFLKTGDSSILPVDDGSCNVDLVGAPESLMEVKQMGVEAQKKFDKLPDELKGDMSMVEFVNSFSQEKFDAFVKAISDRANKKMEPESDGK